MRISRPRTTTRRQEAKGWRSKQGRKDDDGVLWQAGRLQANAINRRSKYGKH